ncbi:hypothetical protein K443DRAFT_29428, partial [Laccaria amethystina LaAM-08-1]
MLQRPGENVPWLPNPIEHGQHSHDGPPLAEWTVKKKFSPNHFYCFERLCAPYEKVIDLIGWANFAQSESPTNIIAFL